MRQLWRTGAQHEVWLNCQAFTDEFGLAVGPLLLETAVCLPAPLCAQSPKRIDSPAATQSFCELHLSGPQSRRLQFQGPWFRPRQRSCISFWKQESSVCATTQRSSFFCPRRPIVFVAAFYLALRICPAPRRWLQKGTGFFHTFKKADGSKHFSCF